MLPLIVNALTDSVSSTVKSSVVVPPAAVVPAADAGASARTQLANAVVASSPMLAYQAEIPAQKPPVRLLTSLPSSQLAAQYLAQTPDATEDDLTLFARREAPANAAAEEESPDEFIASLRAARGDATPPKAKAMANAAARSMAVNVRDTSAATTSAAPMSGKLPPVRTETGARKPGIAQVRGALAYQLTDTRNETKPATITAIS